MSVRASEKGRASEFGEIVRKHKAGIRRLTVEWPDYLAPADVEQVRHLRRALGLCSYCGTHPARQFCRWDPKRRDENALPLAPKTPAQMRRAASKERYEASPKGRAAAAKYAASEKGRARHSRYNRSPEGRARAIAHNRTAKGRARTLRFEATQHRREYKALSIFGTPYRDMDVTETLTWGGPAWGEKGPFDGLKFKRISARCPHCTRLGRKRPSMSSRLIPIRRALSATAPAGREQVSA